MYIASTDSRDFTDYRPSCFIFEEQKKQLGAKNNFEYRQTLNKKGLDIIKQKWNDILKNVNKH